MTDIVWEEPPAKHSSRIKSIDYETVVGELKANPGQWAMVFTTKKQGQVASVAITLKRMGCETTQRKQQDGSVKVYARYEPF